MFALKLCVCVCVRACVRTCVRACVCIFFCSDAFHENITDSKNDPHALKTYIITVFFHFITDEAYFKMIKPVHIKSGHKLHL